jgi:hypothetical protein
VSAARIPSSPLPQTGRLPCQASIGGRECQLMNAASGMELLRRDLQVLEARMDTKLATLEARLLNKMNDQTKTLFRTFLVTNSVMVLAVATLAFGAARLT